MSESTHPVPGDLVRIRDQRWRVIRCTALPPQGRSHDKGGIGLLEVAAAERGGDATRATFVLPFDRCDRLPFATRPRLVGIRRWRRLVRPLLAAAVPSWGSLRTPARARVNLIPFQLEPALALVRGRSCRFLIADAVGLGKTIQAGLMIAETLDRLPGGRVLVITPAALREQWIEELQDRFGLTPTVLDAGHAMRAAANLPEGVNPWTIDPLIVTSIDYIKRADVIRSVEGLVWDMVVFDEAHGLAGRSDRAAAAGALAERARAVVMLSATPHSGDEDAFRRLCAIGELDDAAPLMIFRRTREALGTRSPRRSRLLRIRPTPAEDAMHLGLANYITLAREQSDTAAAHLAMSVLERRAASSAASLAASIERRIVLLSDDLPPDGPQLHLPFGGDAEDDAPGEELWAPALHDRRQEIAQLQHLLSLAQAASRGESKLMALVRLLDRVDEPAIVFTQYRDTLTTIGCAIGRPYAELHGGLSLRERREAARRFTHGDARLLLATDAASEGLNLHHRCRLVINLEMPWTPVRLEQRVGRVDRIGQTRIVHAIHLIATNTSEEVLAARVAERAAVANAIPGGSCEGASLDSAIECARLQVARALDADAPPYLDSRPVIAVSTRHSHSGCWGLRLSIGDSESGATLESLIGICATVPTLGRRDAVVLLRALCDLPEVRARLTEALGAETVRFQLEIAPALDRLEARERAILAALKDQRARLSATLLQRGLFDRRLERAASAQTRLLEEADAGCAARLSLIERLRRARAFDARPVFGISLR